MNNAPDIYEFAIIDRYSYVPKYVNGCDIIDMYERLKYNDRALDKIHKFIDGCFRFLLMGNDIIIRMR